MIVKMKKVTLFLLEKEKDDALHKLRKLGVLHIKNIKPPVSEDISLLEQKISNVEKVINFINSFEEIKA
ncbi:MAG: ATPase, partial [Candidatus Neomarinimicrobiota bacterium]